MIDRWLQQLLAQMRPEALLGSLAALGLLIGLGGYLYVLKPPLQEIRQLAEEGAGNLLAESAIEEVGAARLARLEADVEALRERLYGASSQVPPDRMESWVINRLDRLSMRHAVQLVSVSPEDRKAVLSFDELPYHVHVRAGYFDLFAWLNEVERELRPLLVKEFELSSAGQEGLVGMKLRLVSYRAREDAA